MMVDTHAHLDFAQFDEDRDEVIGRAREAGVGVIINVGFDLESSRAAVALAERHPQIHATVGYHPHEAAALGEAELGNLAELATHPKVVGLGEMGLDFYREYAPRQVQLQSFQAQLELARRLGLPVIIHSRQASEETYHLMAQWVQDLPAKSPRGIMHCFSGDLRLAHRYIELGFFISLAGPVTYPSAAQSSIVARDIPLEALLVETDAPFLAPQPHRGRRNEPAYLGDTAARIAALRGVEAGVVATQTASNAANLFRLSL